MNHKKELLWGLRVHTYICKRTHTHTHARMHANAQPLSLMHRSRPSRTPELRAFTGLELSSQVGSYMGVSEKLGVPYLGVLIIRIRLFRVLYRVPLFLETPIYPLCMAPILLTSAMSLDSAWTCEVWCEKQNSQRLIIWITGTESKASPGRSQ